MAKIVIVLLFCLAWGDSHAQFVQWTSNSSSDTDTSTVQPVGMDIDGQSNVYVTGTFVGGMTIQGKSLYSSKSEMYFAKYDSSGQLIWLKQAVGAGDFSGNIKVDHAGNIVLCGTLSHGGSVLGSPVSGTGFVAKIDPGGNLIWIVSDNFTNAGPNLDIDQNNNIYVFGTSYPNAAISKRTPNGQLIWSNTIVRDGCCDPLWPTGIDVDLGGNVIVTGYFDSGLQVGDYSFQTFGTSMFTVKYDASGDLLWAQQLSAGGVPKEVNGIDVTTDANQNIFLAARFNGTLSLGGYAYTSENTESGFILKLDPSGKFLWVRVITTFFTWISQNWDSNGFLYVTGGAENSLQYGSFGIYRPREQAFIMKLDPLQGSLISFFESEGNYFGQGVRVAVDSKGNIFNMGEFTDSLKLDCFTLAGGGPESMYLFKMKRFPPSPNLKVSGDTLFCAGVPGDFSIVPIAGDSVYQWNFPNGTRSTSGSFITRGSINVTMNPDADTQTVHVSTTIGCQQFSSIPIVLRLSRNAPPTGIISPGAICGGQQVTLIAAGPQQATSYSWVLPPGMSTAANLNAAPDTLHVFVSNQFSQGVVSVSSLGGCVQNSVSATLQVTPLPQKPIIKGPAMICPLSRDSVFSVLPDSLATTFAWTLPAGLTITSGAGNTNAIHLGALSSFQSGTLQVQSIGVCGAGPSSDTVAVALVPDPGKPTGILGPDHICLGQTNVEYDGQMAATYQRYVWTIPPNLSPSGTLVVTSDKVTLSPTQAGLNQIGLAGQNQCNRRGDFLYKSVEVTAPLSKPVVQKSPCDLQLKIDPGTEVIDTFEWFLGNATILNSDTSMLAPLDSGQYSIVVSNFCGSQRSDPVEVRPARFDQVFIPNVITPNGDGKNDFFRVDKSLMGSELLVVDRWGKRVYQSPSYANDWQASGLAAGTYYYVVTNVCIDKPIKGWLSIVY